MPSQGLSPPEHHDSRARAKVIYDSIKGKLESSFKGKLLTIEVESGEHFIQEGFAVCIVCIIGTKVHLTRPRPTLLNDGARGGIAQQAPQG
jgi:hypothetical protein